MTKMILLALVVLALLVSGCVSNSPADTDQKQDIQDPESHKNDSSDTISPIEQNEKETEEPETLTNDFSDTIDECNSLCNVSADDYCQEERVIIINGTEVTGTCRAFARQGNVEGFSKCETFCKDYPSSGTMCEVDGKTDETCDGIAD